MDAWLLISVSFGLYAAFSTAFSGASILGASAVGQILCLLLPAILYSKWKTGSVFKGLRLRRVNGGILWRVVFLALTFIGLGELLQLATQPLIDRYFSNGNATFEFLNKLLKPNTVSDLVANFVIVALLVPVC